MRQQEEKITFFPFLFRYDSFSVRAQTDFKYNIQSWVSLAWARLSINWGAYRNPQETVTNLAEQASKKKKTNQKWVQTARCTEYGKSVSKRGRKCDDCCWDMFSRVQTWRCVSYLHDRPRESGKPHSHEIRGKSVTWLKIRNEELN